MTTDVSETSSDRHQTLVPPGFKPATAPDVFDVADAGSLALSGRSESRCIGAVDMNGTDEEQATSDLNVRCFSAADWFCGSYDKVGT